jgi:hypothetical protein
VSESPLLNRLRGVYTVGENGEYPDRSFAEFIPPISLEAADAIEKLEAENAQLKARLAKIESCTPGGGK